MSDVGAAYSRSQYKKSYLGFSPVIVLDEEVQIWNADIKYGRLGVRIVSKERGAQVPSICDVRTEEGLEASGGRVRMKPIAEYCD